MGHAASHHDCDKTTTVFECRFPYRCHTIGYLNEVQVRTTVESIGANRFQTFMKLHIIQFCTTRKSIPTDRHHCCRNFYDYQVRTLVKSIASNAHDALSHGKGH